MWILWVAAFVALFLLLAQFISRLPGENFAGLKKIIPDEVQDTRDGVITENAIERISGNTLPYFENLLLIELKSAQELRVSWKLDADFYAQKAAAIGEEHLDATKAVLRLNFTGGGRHTYKDHPLRLSDNPTEIFIDAAGSTVSAEMGFFTAAHNFIPLLVSNEVTVPA